MRHCQYNGEPDRIGRHGMVDTGDEVYLDEAEFATVADDPDWELLNTAEFAAMRTAPFPKPGDEFDLTSIEWTSKALSANLYRKGKPTLKKIARAMQAQGITCVESDNAFQARVIAETIAFGASVNGWTRLDKYTVRLLNDGDISMEDVEDGYTGPVDEPPLEVGGIAVEADYGAVGEPHEPAMGEVG